MKSSFILRMWRFWPQDSDAYLHNNMQFRDAYDLYLKLLDSKEARDNSVKRLNVFHEGNREP